MTSSDEKDVVFLKTDKKRIVIVGGGFAGVHLARGLARADAQVVLIDKNNYHTFQPLLYQVATAGLEAPSIVYPFRKLFEDQDNCFFRLGEVLAVDPNIQQVETSIGKISYDILVMATGATTNFYGNAILAEKAVSIKSLDDAIGLRNTLLSNYEAALLTKDEGKLNSLMDVVIVGGGPTGVEIAGALSELKRHVFPRDYKELDFVMMDIHLVQSGPLLLKGMSEEASHQAKAFLQDMGVKIWLNCRVKGYDGLTVKLDTGEELCTRTLIWAAGVTGAPVNGLRDDALAPGYRFIVDETSRIKGYDNIFAIGDIAHMPTANNEHGYPMMAQPALQQGKWLAKNLKKMLAGKPMESFRFKDQGSMATIGRNRAVADLNIFKGAWNTQGFKAWLIWMFIHLMSLIGYRNRVVVLLNWIWNYISYDTGIRLIIGSNRATKTETESEEKAII